MKIIWVVILMTGFNLAVLAAGNHATTESDQQVKSAAHKASESEHDHAADSESKADKPAHTEEEDGHDHEAEKEDAGHDEGGSDAELSQKQQALAGIKTVMTQTQTLGLTITAPGEVVLNAYRTSKITPRIPAQIIKRHVQLGDKVEKGQILVTLSSVEMASAQGGLMEANSEWRRVQKLGRKVVSEKRYIAAQIARQQAVTKVLAYGMTKTQIKKFTASKATGEFQLLSFQKGTVIDDDFVMGEMIEPGRTLMTISDENQLWVEARLTPMDAKDIALGAAAKVQVGERWITGKVTQARHTLDENTRTLALHVEVANFDDHLHPGQFVSVVIEGGKKQQGIVLPLAAVLRSTDGDWQVFIETAPGRFEGKEVEVLNTLGDKMLISGLEEGIKVVSQGAFFVQSEIAKSGFSVHNH